VQVRQDANSHCVSAGRKVFAKMAASQCTKGATRF
jgi:hypothetical protein